MTDNPPEGAILEEHRRFLQSAVHDLRAARRRTGISAELLLNAEKPQERADLTAQLLQGLTKMDELLNGIDRYANVLIPYSYTFNLFPSATAVRFAAANLDREIRAAGATLEIGDLPEIRGDRDKLVELFQALIANSIKFRGTLPPAIQISASRSPDGWLFCVTDNGVGIPPKYQDRLFVPFIRLQSADAPGAGLGLAISKKIVEGHGGRIWIDRPVGPGVSILFILPTLDGD